MLRKPRTIQPEPEESPTPRRPPRKESKPEPLPEPTEDSTLAPPEETAQSSESHSNG